MYVLLSAPTGVSFILPSKAVNKPVQTERERVEAEEWPHWPFGSEGTRQSSRRRVRHEEGEDMMSWHSAEACPSPTWGFFYSSVSPSVWDRRPETREEEIRAQRRGEDGQRRSDYLEGERRLNEENIEVNWSEEKKRKRMQWFHSRWWHLLYMSARSWTQSCRWDFLYSSPTTGSGSLLNKQLNTQTLSSALSGGERQSSSLNIPRFSSGKSGWVRRNYFQWKHLGSERFIPPVWVMSD